MKVRPLTLAQANMLVAQLHRHHKPARGHRFSLGLFDGDRLVGACIVGRPVARMTDAYCVAEVTRLVTDGTKNACSKLYAAAARSAEAMGFDSIQTFTLPEEGGVSLRASGWECLGESAGGDWNSATHKNRRQDQPMGKKWKWERRFA